MKKKVYLHLIVAGFILLTLNGCKPISGLEQNYNKDDTPETTLVEEVVVEPSETIEEPEEIIVPFTYVQIKADALNVRKEASVNTSILDKVYDQSIHTILEETTDADGAIWYKIKSENGEIGWISGEYCIGGWEVDGFETSVAE